MKLANTGHVASLTKRQLQARYTRDAKQRMRKALQAVKAERKTVRRQKTLKASQLRHYCRGSVRRARARAKELQQEAVARAKAEGAALVARARGHCDIRKEKELRAAGKHLAALELEAARAKERYLAEKLGAALEREARALRSSKRERAAESDDEVRANLSPDLVPIFNSVKRQIKASPGQSRTEAFEHWLHDNASEVSAMLAEAADEETQKLIDDLQRRDKALRAMLRRKVVEPADLKKLGISCDDVESLGLSCDSPEDVQATVAAYEAPRRRSSSSAPF